MKSFVKFWFWQTTGGDTRYRVVFFSRRHDLQEGGTSRGANQSNNASIFPSHSGATVDHTPRKNIFYFDCFKKDNYSFNCQERDQRNQKWNKNASSVYKGFYLDRRKIESYLKGLIVDNNNAIK